MLCFYISRSHWGQQKDETESSVSRQVFSLSCLHLDTWYECEVYEHDDEHNAVSNLTYYLTLSLPQCHLKMTNKSVKFEIL